MGWRQDSLKAAHQTQWCMDNAGLKKMGKPRNLVISNKLSNPVTGEPGTLCRRQTITKAEFTKAFQVQY